MSVSLIRLFVSNLNKTLPRHPVRTEKNILAITSARLLSVMEAADVTKDEENKSIDIVPNKLLTRYNKRRAHRDWETKPPGEIKKPYERIKRKKMAMLLGYSGVEYYGMQRNPGVQTIEEELLKALLDAKYITQEDFENAQNAQFQRSSRTDKGVSAAEQVVSLKLPLEVNVEEINKRLPETIKVFAVKRVTNRFNSKSKCNARSYSYTLPTYVFEPSLVTHEKRKAYRIPAEKIEKLNSILGVYKGTKSYHNFTEKKHHQDPSSSRYMMSFSVEKVFVYSDMEFAVLIVKGQSFMLHQIRKMVGLAIAIMRGHADSSILEKAFGKDKVMIPTAPGLGLVLNKVHYDRYDARHKGTHDSLTWDKEEETIQKFKEDHIYPNIVRGEIERDSMGTWLEKLSKHSYEPTEEMIQVEKADAEGVDDESDAEDLDDEKDNDEEKCENGVVSPLKDVVKEGKVDDVTS
ncbi:pseudouridylate synthase 1 homolog isoform X2 [Bombyx mori]|uniref:Pseudouridylate synthase 1 homolog n=1 Tax=Bombyx mori TaxID=7091 RepID=A0A8R1WJ44_BOMMO|nr:tRNA pseudouridine synthase A isoform X2 [Bombyx mori]